jgi:hypothetical protein
MRETRSGRIVRGLGLVCAAVTLAAAPGCQTIGPAVIRIGRPAYNEVITQTNSEQILAMIVRMRYAEPSGLLAVSSVTANVRYQVNAEAQFGIGPQSNYVGNLVPFGVGGLYEENPTISYTPVQGEAYLTALLSPIPIDMAALVLSATGHAPPVTLLLLRSINGIQNPDVLDAPGDAPDPRFARVAALLASLDRRGSIMWFEAPGAPSEFWMHLHGAGQEHDRDVEELFALLGLGAPPEQRDSVRLPVRFGGGEARDDAVNIRTRSVFDLFRLAAAAVEIPEAQLRSGLAPPLPPPGPAASLIRIKRSSGRPADALVAVQHHGWWWSIDGLDAQSKFTFRMLDTLMSVRIAESTKGASTPILTLPASK